MGCAELLVRECAARDEGGVRALLGFLRRLLDEHSRTTLEVHAPPTHPLARALHHRGATAEANNFQGSALLALHDWPSVLRASAPAWERALDRAHGNAIGLDLGAERLQLSLGDDGLVVAALDEGAAAEGARLWVPPGWGPGLLTGQRSHRDLAFDARVAQNSQLDERGWQALEELFPGGHPMWSYSPVFDLADE